MDVRCGPGHGETSGGADKRRTQAATGERPGPPRGRSRVNPHWYFFVGLLSTCLCTAGLSFLSSSSRWRLYVRIMGIGLQGPGDPSRLAHERGLTGPGTGALQWFSPQAQTQPGTDSQAGPSLPSPPASARPCVPAFGPSGAGFPVGSQKLRQPQGVPDPRPSGCPHPQVRPTLRQLRAKGL